MSIGNIELGVPKQIAASTLIKAATDGGLLGVFCSSSSSGTVAFYDSATAATNNKIVDTVNLTAGTWYNIPVTFVNGLYAVIGGTASVTVSYL